MCMRTSLASAFAHSEALQFLAGLGYYYQYLQGPWCILSSWESGGTFHYSPLSRQHIGYSCHGNKAAS